LPFSNKAQLSKLGDEAVNGEPFVISKAGKPLVKVTALDTPSTPRRSGFLQGEVAAPEDFDSMNQLEIADLFEGRE